MSEIIQSLIFDGHDLVQEFGLVISGVGANSAPVRELESVQISGRSGDLLFDNKRYSNVEAVYKCAISDDFYNKFDELKSVLLSPEGYRELVDSRYPDYTRMARVSATVEADRVVSCGGTFQIVFDCKPQRYLTAEPVTFTHRGTVVNQTNIKLGKSLPKKIRDDLKTRNMYEPNGYYVMVRVSDTKVYTRLNDTSEGNYIAIIWDSREQFWSSSFGALNVATTTSDIIFKRKPRQYVTTKNNSDTSLVTLYNDGVSNKYSENLLVNPTEFDSKPLLEIALDGTPTDNAICISIDKESGIILSSELGSNLRIDGEVFGVNKLYIDCETLDAWCDATLAGYGGELQTTINANKYVDFVGEPRLVSGNNFVLFTGAVSSVTVHPRWWVL